MNKVKYIYKIENLINKKVYIGLTNNTKRRESRHFTDLKYNRHDSEHLQRSYNKYGVNNFKFEVLYSQKCDYLHIGEMEKKYIEIYDSYNNGYNMNEGGIGNNGFVSKFSKEDVFNITATVENVPRCGGVLSELFDTSRNSIARIANGETCIDNANNYKRLSAEEKFSIFKAFEEKHNIKNQVQTRLGDRARILSEHEYLYVLEYDRRHKRKSPTMAKILKCSDSTLRLFLRGKTNISIHNIYDSLSSQEKDVLYSSAKNLFENSASLCSNA